MANSSSYSDVLSVLCVDYAQTGPPPSVLLLSHWNITIKWPNQTDFNANGRDYDPPTYYILEVTTNNNAGPWTALNTIAGGHVNDFWYCKWPFIDPTKLLYFRVRAQNGVGLSPYTSTVLVVTPV